MFPRAHTKPIQQSLSAGDYRAITPDERERAALPTIAAWSQDSWTVCEFEELVVTKFHQGTMFSRGVLDSCRTCAALMGEGTAYGLVALAMCDCE